MSLRRLCQALLNVWNCLAHLPFPLLPPLTIAEHVLWMRLPCSTTVPSFCMEGFGTHLLIIPSVVAYLSSTSQPYSASVFIQSKDRWLLLRCLYYERQKSELAVFVTWGIMTQIYVCLPVQFNVEVSHAMKLLFPIAWPGCTLFFLMCSIVPRLGSHFSKRNSHAVLEYFWISAMWRKIGASSWGWSMWKSVTSPWTRRRQTQRKPAHYYQ